MRPVRLQILALAVLVALAVACGASSRTKALDTATMALDRSYAGFHAFDEARQRAIIAAAVAASTSVEQGEAAGQAALAEWRIARDVVKDAVIAALRLIGLARVDANTPIDEVLAKVQAAYHAIAEVKQEGSP